MTDVIYCSDGNPKLTRIAVEAGLLYGARLPGTVYEDIAPLYFADQNWKRPDRARYMAKLEEYRPHMATVLDWERPDQLPEVLSWAEEAAQIVQVVVVVPKAGGISKLPREINGKEIRLGYSVPTNYGGTELPTWQFDGWPVHLLGGSPHRQMDLAHYLAVKSVDGNMANKMATRFCMFWQPGTARYANNRYWPRLREADGYKWGKDAYYEALRRSCVNIMAEWKRLEAGKPLAR